MVKIDLGALNEAERRRYEREHAAAQRRLLATPFTVPPLVYVLLLGAGFGALNAPALLPWGPLLGAALIAGGAYALGLHGAAGERASRDAARVDRLTDALAFIGLSGVDGRARAARPEDAGEAGEPVRRYARFPSKRRPILRAVAGGAAPGASAAELDQPLSGEPELDGAVE